MRWSCLLALVLTGCAADPVYQPVEVPMPVGVTCHIPEITVPEFPVAATDQTIAEKTRDVLVELTLRRAFEARLTAALRACQ